MSPDSPAERYHRRRRAPILVVLAVLLIAGGVTWFQVLKPVPAASTSCNVPGPAPKVTTTSRSKTTTAGPSTTGTAKATPTTTSTTATTTSIITSLGSFANANSLTGVRPAEPAAIGVTVYNASQASGIAKTVTNDLRSAGFLSILPANNDPLYPAQDLRCTAEIRYGQAGTAAARTLLLVQPCAQLVLDNRLLDTVDLSLGGNYTYAPLTATVIAQLKSIHDSTLARVVIEGTTAAARPQAPVPALPSAAGCT